jgi:hypothetical protein
MIQAQIRWSARSLSAATDTRAVIEHHPHRPLAHLSRVRTPTLLI